MLESPSITDINHATSLNCSTMILLKYDTIEVYDKDQRELYMKRLKTPCDDTVVVYAHTYTWYIVVVVAVLCCVVL